MGFEGSKHKIVDQKASDGRVRQNGFQFLRWLSFTSAGQHRLEGGSILFARFGDLLMEYNLQASARLPALRAISSVNNVSKSLKDISIYL